MQKVASRILTRIACLLFLLVFSLPAMANNLASGYSLLQTCTYGGGGGAPFDGYHDPMEWGKIRQINVHSGCYVDSLEFIYANGRNMSCGGGGGTLSCITLDCDEYITQITVKYGSWLDQISFISNKRVYGPYGGNGGSAVKTINLDGLALQGVYGRSGWYIDQIGFYYGKQPSIPNEVYRSNMFGGGGGCAFDDLGQSIYLEKISAIKIRSGCLIDNLNVAYGDRVEEYPHGGNGGSPSVFVLDKDEYIVEVSGRTGCLLDQLQFRTSKGRCSPVYGGGGGSPFKVAPKDEKGRPMVLKAIFGGSGAVIDRIGFYFAKAVPISYEMQTLTYDESKITYIEDAPVALKSIYLQNNTNVAQTVSSSTTISIAETETTEVSNSIGVSSSFSLASAGGCACAFVIAGSITVGFEFDTTYTTSKSCTKTRSDTFTFNAVVGPCSTIKASAICRMGSYNVPWSGEALVTYSGCSTPVLEKVSGVLRGVKTASLYGKYDLVK